jgi:hypothetical protein
MILCCVSHALTSAAAAACCCYPSQDNYLSGAVSDDVVNLKALRVFMLTGNRHSAQDKAVITDSLKVYLPNLVRQQGFRI